MSTSAQAVFLKYVTITPNSALPKIRPAPSVSPASTSSGYASSTGNAMDEETQCSEMQPKGKKRRLDHLTWEEKIQRKKLKNRVAAQTSRDRKKARMEEMELEIKNLTQTTEILQNKCESLQAINDSLLEKNQKLDMELELMRQQLEELQQQQKRVAANMNSSLAAGACAGCESNLIGSAVSKYTDPLQQGSTQMDSQSTKEQLRKSNSMAALWRIVALCLLYKTCSSSMKSSMPANWKNLPKACLPISQQTWKQAIERAMKLLPKLQAEQSDCLDQWWGPQQSAWNPANIAQQVAA